MTEYGGFILSEHNIIPNTFRKGIYKRKKKRKVRELGCSLRQPTQLNPMAGSAQRKRHTERERKARGAGLKKRSR